MRLILYDLDGTLADTRRDISNAANYMRAQMNLPPLSGDEICGYVGLGLKQLVESCLGDGDAARAGASGGASASASQRVDRGMAIYRAFYAEHLLDHTRLYAGVREVLEHFRAGASGGASASASRRGARQAVITNKPAPYSRQILEALGVAHYFLEIVGGDSGFAKKPDPESLRAILRRKQVAPAQAIFVGDSPIDVETGAQAGVLTVAVAQGFSSRAELESAHPDRMVEDFRQLLVLARKEGW